MNLTKEKLIELGWREDEYGGLSYMYINNLALISSAGAWKLSRLIFGQPHFPVQGPPISIFTEADYYRVMSDIHE